MSFDYDVAIVGAGPIGSSLAYELAQNGLKVCLIDKKKRIGLPLQCAGIVNKRISSLCDIPKELILNEAKGAFIHSKNHSLTVSKKESQAYVLDRVAFDQYLFNRAREHLDTYLSSKVVDIDSELGIVQFKFDCEIKTIHSKLIVGADGPLSLSAKKVNSKLNYFNASQYLVKVDKIDEMSFVDLYAWGDLFPGFIWAIPVYNNIYRIGLFSEDDYKTQSKILDDYLLNDFRYEEYEVLEKYKGKIPIYDKSNKLFKNRLILIGDAASQVKPTTGGGILIGLESVQFAKDAILNALNTLDFDKIDSLNDLNSNEDNSNDLDSNEDSLKLNNFLDELSKILENYQNDFENRFSKEFEIQFKVQKSLSTLSNDDLDYVLTKLKEKDADKLISEYGDMDNQSKLVKEFLKRGLIFSLAPKIHKKELAKIWLLNKD